jgi:phosphopantothenoylcysteine decarboxylase
MLLEGTTERYTKDPAVWKALEHVEIFHDANEWQDYTVGTDTVLHIELRKWADVLVIAPLSANTLGKIANGLCDNLLTCVVRCWDPAKPMVLAPAMNTYMWENPFTARHLGVLKEFPFMRIVPPVSKTLACKDTGVGALAEVEDILRITFAFADELRSEEKRKAMKLEE